MSSKPSDSAIRLKQLSSSGYDLVEMTEHKTTCVLCSSLQGRVYSISGKDKRFPPLSIAFPNGTYEVHPGCAHIVVPWIESMQTQKEIRAAIKRSNAPFDASVLGR